MPAPERKRAVGDGDGLYPRLRPNRTKTRVIDGDYDVSSRRSGLQNDC